MTGTRPISCFWFHDRGLVAIHVELGARADTGIDILYRSREGTHRALVISDDSSVSVIRATAAPPFELLIVPVAGEPVVHRFDVAGDIAGHAGQITASARWQGGTMEVVQRDTPMPWAEIVAVRAGNVWQPAQQRRAPAVRQEARVSFRIAGPGRDNYNLVIEVEGLVSAAPRTVTVHHIHHSHEERHTLRLHPETAHEGKVRARTTLGEAVAMDRIYVTSEPGVVLTAEAMSEGGMSHLKAPAVLFMRNSFAPIDLPKPTVPSWTGPSSFASLYTASSADVQQLMWNARPLLETAERAGLGGSYWSVASLEEFMTIPILGHLFIASMARVRADDRHALLSRTAGGPHELFTRWAMTPETFRMWRMHKVFKELPPPEPSPPAAGMWDLERVVHRLVGDNVAVAELIAREGGIAVTYVCRCAIEGMTAPQHWNRIGWLFATLTPPAQARTLADAIDLVTQDVVAWLPDVFCRDTALWKAANAWRERRKAIIAAPVPDPQEVRDLETSLHKLLHQLNQEMAAFRERRAKGELPLIEISMECSPEVPLHCLATLLKAQKRLGAATSASPVGSAGSLTLEAALAAAEAAMISEQDTRLGRLIGWLAALTTGGSIPDWPVEPVAPNHLERDLDIVTTQLGHACGIGPAYGPAAFAILRAEADGKQLIDAQQQTLSDRLDADVGGELAAFDGTPTRRPALVARLRHLVDDLSDRRVDLLGWQAWQGLASRLPEDLRASLAFSVACPVVLAEAARLSAATRTHAEAWQRRQARSMAVATLVQALPLNENSAVLRERLALVAAGFKIPTIPSDTPIDQPELFADLARLAARIRWVEEAERTVETWCAGILDALASENGLVVEPEDRNLLVRMLCGLEGESATAIDALPEVMKLCDARRELLAGHRPNVIDLAWLIDDTNHRAVLARAARSGDVKVLLSAPDKRAVMVEAIAKAQGIIDTHYHGRSELRVLLTGRLVERFQALQRRIGTLTPELRPSADVRATHTDDIWNWLLQVHGALANAPMAEWAVAVAARLRWPELLAAR